MNKANWLTGAAGFAGNNGLGLGWWEAESVAAAIISVGVLNDGIKALRSSTAELVYRAPRALCSASLSEVAQNVCDRLQAEFPDATARLRKPGRLIRAEFYDAHPSAECRHPHTISRTRAGPGGFPRSFPSAPAATRPAIARRASPPIPMAAERLDFAYRFV
jgi:hypothetical protein